MMTSDEKERERNLELAVIYTELADAMRAGHSMYSPPVMSVLKKLTVNELLTLESQIKDTNENYKDAAHELQMTRAERALRAKVKEFSFGSWLEGEQ